MKSRRPDPTPDELQWWVLSNSMPDADDVCRIWRHPRANGSAGSIRIGDKNVGAARVALMLDTGHDGGGLVACHRCDNPRCVRPEHLFWGTPSDRAGLIKGRRVYPKRRRARRNWSAISTWELLRGMAPPVR